MLKVAKRKFELSDGFDCIWLSQCLTELIFLVLPNANRLEQLMRTKFLVEILTESNKTGK